MNTIYALIFSNRIYIGMTRSLERRIREHKNGKTKSTKNRGNFKVIKIEVVADRKEARAREKYWKSGCGKEQFKNWSGSSVG